MKKLLLKCMRDGKDMVLVNGKHTLHFRCERGQYKGKDGERYCTNSVSFNDQKTLQYHIEDLMEEKGIMEKEKGKVKNINGKYIYYEIDNIGDEYITVKVDLENDGK